MAEFLRTTMKIETCVIFGGTGFIGTHFCRHLLENALVEKVVLADIKPLSEERRAHPVIAENLEKGRILYVKLDVRFRKDFEDLPGSCDLIANFAAVHREPGHQPAEYYETNLPGAENVCWWAGQVGCAKIVFTSSIAPYGPSEQERTEDSIPTPETAYGGSKLVAEKIHQMWQASAPGRFLLIVRPGVVFGPGEGGNVTRLIRAVIGRYFVYMGNESTRKAGGYVKELCHSLIWALEHMNETRTSFFLYNFTMPIPPSVKDYVSVICSVAGVKRHFLHVPFKVVYALSVFIDSIFSLFGVKQSINPVRVRKLVRSNNIVPKVLNDNGYVYVYSLSEAMLDWKRENPNDWSL